MPDPGPTSERLEALRSRWESDRGSRVFLQLADEYRRLGSAEDAVRVLEDGLSENPRYPAAQVALGRCQLELGRVSDATATLERVIESDPTQMVAYRLLVDAYVAQGKPEEARQRLRVYGLLNDADPDIAELRRRIGLLERQGSAEGTPGSLALEEPPAEEPPAEEAERDASEPSGDLEAAVASGTFAPRPEPFPDLAAVPHVRALPASAGDDLFGLEPPVAPLSAPLSGSELFELGGFVPPPAPDLSALLEGKAESPAAEPAAEAEEAPLESAPPSGGQEGAGPPAAPTEEVPPPPPPPPPSVPEAGRPTVTLGVLYLRQGHTREAEAIFHAVLERDPDNAEALRHLEEIGDQLRAELGAPRRLTAEDLLAGWDGDPREVGTTRRKRYVLERYADRIRGRAPGDVH
jgi:Tfp pilus assembly protein PilF